MVNRPTKTGRWFRPTKSSLSLQNQIESSFKLKDS